MASSRPRREAVHYYRERYTDERDANFDDVALQQVAPDNWETATSQEHGSAVETPDEWANKDRDRLDHTSAGYLTALDSEGHADEFPKVFRIVEVDWHSIQHS